MTTPSPTHKHEASKEEGILSDEMIEKAARAVYEIGKYGFEPDWLDYEPRLKDDYRRDALAALTAVLPDLIEECAKVADAEGQKEIFNDHRGFCRATARDIARAIRSLIPKDS